MQLKAHFKNYFSRLGLELEAVFIYTRICNLFKFKGIAHLRIIDFAYIEDLPPTVKLFFFDDLKVHQTKLSVFLDGLPHDRIAYF